MDYGDKADVTVRISMQDWSGVKQIQAVATRRPTEVEAYCPDVTTAGDVKEETVPNDVRPFISIEEAARRSRPVAEVKFSKLCVKQTYRFQVTSSQPPIEGTDELLTFERYIDYFPAENYEPVLLRFEFRQSLLGELSEDAVNRAALKWKKTDTLVLEGDVVHIGKTTLESDTEEDDLGKPKNIKFESFPYEKLNTFMKLEPPKLNGLKTAWFVAMGQMAQLPGKYEARGVDFPNTALFGVEPADVNLLWIQMKSENNVFVLAPSDASAEYMVETSNGKLNEFEKAIVALYIAKHAYLNSRNIGTLIIVNGVETKLSDMLNVTSWGETIAMGAYRFTSAVAVGILSGVGAAVGAAVTNLFSGLYVSPPPDKKSDDDDDDDDDDAGEEAQLCADKKNGCLQGHQWL
jgi:hypothetical protein